MICRITGKTGSVGNDRHLIFLYILAHIPGVVCGEEDKHELKEWPLERSDCG